VGSELDSTREIASLRERQGLHRRLTTYRGCRDASLGPALYKSIVGAVPSMSPHGISQREFTLAAVRLNPFGADTHAAKRHHCHSNDACDSAGSIE
jgi:hypothetical protein